MFVLSSGGTIDAFIDAVFNYPTLAEELQVRGLRWPAAARAEERAAARRRAAREPLPPAMRPWFAGLCSAGPAAAGQPLTLCGDGPLAPMPVERLELRSGRGQSLARRGRARGFMLALGATDSDARALLDSLRARGFPFSERIRGRPTWHWSAPDLLWKSWGVRPEANPEDGPAAARRRYEVLRAQGRRSSDDVVHRPGGRARCRRRRFCRLPSGRPARPDRKAHGSHRRLLCTPHETTRGG